MQQNSQAGSAYSSSDVLDKTRIALYRQRRTGFLELIVNAYLDEAPRHLGELRKGVAAANLDAVRMAAHTLKSSSANVGAVRLSGVLQQMESAAVKKENATLAELLATIGGEYFAAEEALKGLLVQCRSAPAT